MSSTVGFKTKISIPAAASCVGRLMLVKLPPFITKPEEWVKNDMQFGCNLKKMEPAGRRPIENVVSVKLNSRISNTCTC